VCLLTWGAAPGWVITGFSEEIPMGQPFFLMESCLICQASKLFSSLRAGSEEHPLYQRFTFLILTHKKGVTKQALQE